MLGLAKRVGARLSLFLKDKVDKLNQYQLFILPCCNFDWQDFAYIYFRSIWRSSCASTTRKLLGQC